MKREIRFRGKTIDGKWAFGSLVKLDVGCVIITNNTTITNCALDYQNSLVFSRDELEVVIPETVGQFTGLKDKNGVDIYEGDILQMWLEDSVESAGGLLHQMYVIFTPEKGFTLWGKRMTMEDAEPMHEMLQWKECEITGNIHDNPELLKTE